jgi:DNA (cytosine-5)-methyltransferase 1
MNQACNINALDARLSLMSKYKIKTVSEIKEAAMNRLPNFEVVSLFAGGGGSSTGYRMAGGKVLAVNEFIPEAITTYEANWPDTTVLSGDVRNLTADQILAAIGKEKGELDLLDGSPPCSAFSTAGARDKNWGKTKKYSDSEQDSVEDLFFEYIRILRGVMPKVFIAENVAGLTKGKAKGYLNEILRGLKESGYEVSCKILDAKWLGVPQTRTRTIFIGIRKDLWLDGYSGKLHPKPDQGFTSLQDAFDGLSFSDEDRVETDLTRYAVGKELLKLSAGEQSKKYFQLVKCSRKNVAGCLTASAGNTGIACIKHWDNRAFTVAECKRIMSVPDDYVLTGTYKQKVERLGRMVAPHMMRAVAENLCALGVFNERHT